MKQVEISEALLAISRVAEILDYKEPVPHPEPKNISSLYTCLQQPFSTFDGKYMYWHLWHRAAVLFYCIIKNHPLENGNKRTAVILTLLFLYKNGKFLNIRPDNLYDISCIVAESKASKSEEIIELLKKEFKNNLSII